MYVVSYKHQQKKQLIKAKQGIVTVENINIVGCFSVPD